MPLVSKPVLRKILSAIALIAIFNSVALAQPGSNPPKDAKSVDDILKAVDAIKGFGTLTSVETREPNRRTFIVWYCPYSGRDSCHVHGYRFDAKAERWQLFLDRVFDGTISVTVEVGANLTLRNTKGEVIFREK